MTRPVREVLWHRVCLTCEHKFDTVIKDKPCPVCHSPARCYGFKEIHQGSPDAPEEPGDSG